MIIEPWIYPALTAVALVTGFIDSIAGGGGLLMMPALLSTGLPPHLALGTNKLQSLCGVSTALRNYWRGGLVDIRANLGLAAVVFVGAAAGAVLVQRLDSSVLQVVVPVLLFGASLYVLLSPRMGDEESRARLSQRGYAPVAGGVGFYDGFFGPGTGTFFTASLVGLRGMGLTRATGNTKLFNAVSNVAALLVFIAGGQVLWLLGACMAVGSMAGSWLGSRTAMRHGAPLIRPLLVICSMALTGRLLWQWYAG